nr:MAG TPA: hypothetical protein [Caudoviricetes sp.]
MLRKRLTICIKKVLINPKTLPNTKLTATSLPLPLKCLTPLSLTKCPMK